MIKKLITLSATALTVITIGCGGGSGESQGSSFPFGTAPYAIQHNNFNCAVYRDSIADLPVVNISWLWETFGTNPACVDSVMNDGRFEAFQLHLINGVCLRNGNCGGYETFAGLSLAEAKAKVSARDAQVLGRVRATAERASNFLSARGKLGNRCYISPILETDFTSAEFSVVKEVVEPFFPGCQIVFNPVAPQPRVPGTLYELHSADSLVGSECIYNNDGFSVSVPEGSSGFPRFLTPGVVTDQLRNNGQSCELSFLWHHSYNCISGGFVDPRARTCSDASSFHSLGAVISSLE